MYCYYYYINKITINYIIQLLCVGVLKFLFHIFIVYILTTSFFTDIIYLVCFACINITTSQQLQS